SICTDSSPIETINLQRNGIGLYSVKKTSERPYKTDRKNGAKRNGYDLFRAGGLFLASYCPSLDFFCFVFLVKQKNEGPSRPEGALIDSLKDPIPPDFS